MPDNDAQNSPEYQEAVAQVEKFKDLMLEEAKSRQKLAEQIAESIKDIDNDITLDLERLISKAARLEDGRAVFMAKGGSIYVEDDTGTDLASQNLKIEWPENAPSFEEFTVAKARAHPNWEKRKAKRQKKNKPPSYEEFCEARLNVERAEEKVSLIKTYQSDVLSYARTRMSNTEDPPSKEEMTILKNLLENSIIDIENSAK